MIWIGGFKMEFYKISVKNEILNECELDSLMMGIAFLKESGAIKQFNKFQWFGMTNFYFLLDDKKFLDKIETTFKVYKVAEFSTQKIMGDIK